MKDEVGLNPRKPEFVVKDPVSRPEVGLDMKDVPATNNDEMVKGDNSGGTTHTHSLSQNDSVVLPKLDIPSASQD